MMAVEWKEDDTASQGTDREHKGRDGVLLRARVRDTVSEIVQEEWAGVDGRWMEGREGEQKRRYEKGTAALSLSRHRHACQIQIHIDTDTPTHRY